jgi:hypothetical protein
VDEVEIVDDCGILVYTDVASRIVLTSYTGKKLSSETLNMRARKRHELISLQKIKDALTEQVCDNTDVISKVETVSQVNTLVAVVCVVLLKCRQYPKLNPRSISIFWHCTNDLYCTLSIVDKI